MDASKRFAAFVLLAIVITTVMGCASSGSSRSATAYGGGASGSCTSCR